MAFQMNVPRFRKYKFFGNNIWGRLFICKRFRGKDVVLSRINKKLTLKSLTVNPVKLRQKRKSFRTLCLYASLQLKRYYHSIRETHFRRVLRKAVKGLSYKHVRAQDRVFNLLELRLDGLLLKLGLFKHPVQIKQFLRHQHILVNGMIIDLPSVVLEAGDIITFRNRTLASDLLYRFLGGMLTLSREAKRLKVRDMHFVYFPLMVANRLVYVHVCYRTLSLMVLSEPQYVKNVYYPFMLDTSMVLGGYPYVR